MCQEQLIIGALYGSCCRGLWFREGNHCKKSCEWKREDELRMTERKMNTTSSVTKESEKPASCGIAKSSAILLDEFETYISSNPNSLYYKDLQAHLGRINET